MLLAAEVGLEKPYGDFAISPELKRDTLPDNINWGSDH